MTSTAENLINTLVIEKAGFYLLFKYQYIIKKERLPLPT